MCSLSRLSIYSSAKLLVRFLYLGLKVKLAVALNVLNTNTNKTLRDLVTATLWVWEVWISEVTRSDFSLRGTYCTSVSHRSYKVPNGVGRSVLMNLGVVWIQAHFMGLCASSEKLKKPLNTLDRIASSLSNVDVLWMWDITACSIDCLYRVSRRSDEACQNFSRTIAVLLLCLQNSQFALLYLQFVYSSGRAV